MEEDKSMAHGKLPAKRVMAACHQTLRNGNLHESLIRILTNIIQLCVALIEYDKEAMINIDSSQFNYIVHEYQKLS